MTLEARVSVPTDPHARARDNRRGIIAIVGCFTLFMINDTLVKMASEGLPTGQTIFIRGCFSAAMIFVVVLATGQWRQRRRLFQPLLGLRAVLDAIGTVAYLAAMFRMPIGNATAINLSAPLMMTATAALLLREQVGIHRWAAMIAGFIGVLLVVEPSSEGVNAWALLAFGATLFTVGREMVTRWIDPATPALLVILLASIVTAAAAGAISLFEGWQTPSAESIVYLLLAAALLSIAYYLSIVAMRHGEVSLVAAFRYIAIPLALFAGWVRWGEVPTPMGWCGMALLAGAGVYVLQAERRRRRRG